MSRRAAPANTFLKQLQTLPFLVLFSVGSPRYSELAPRRFGVATAQLEWWARLQTRKDRGFEARPWSKAEKPTPLKTNFTTEPATAPPALAFYPDIRTRCRFALLRESCKLMCSCLTPTCSERNFTLTTRLVLVSSCSIA